MRIFEYWRGIALTLGALIGAAVILGATSSAAVALCNSCPAGTVADGNCVNLSNSQEISCPTGGGGGTLNNKYLVPNKYDKYDLLGPPGPLTEPVYDIEQYIRDHPDQFKAEGKEAGINPSTYGTHPTGGVSSSHLGMYIYAPEYSSPGWDGFGGGAVVHNGGASVTDSAGTLAAGTNSPTFRAAVGNGGIGATIDASRFFGVSGTLLLRGVFDYERSNLSYGPMHRWQARRC
jgi:hypothetical protein